MKYKNTCTALGAVILTPLLLLLQQWVAGKLPRSPQPPVKTPDFALMASTEEGLEYHPGKAHHVARAANIYLLRGEFQKAENWLKLGAGEFRYPSLMLLYGSFLIRQKRLSEARRWLNLACHYADRAGEKAFAAYVRRMLASIPPKEVKP